MRAALDRGAGHLKLCSLIQVPFGNRAPIHRLQRVDAQVKLHRGQTQVPPRPPKAMQGQARP